MIVFSYNLFPLAHTQTHIQQINKVRRMLTEVLLDVTTFEIREIASAAIEEFRSKEFVSFW